MRPAAVEPFLRGCAWPAAAGVPYPRCDLGPSGERLPADTRAAATLPVGVRLEAVGNAEAVEVEYHTESDGPGPRGAGAGTHFALFRGDKPVSEAPAVLGSATLRLDAGRGPGRVTIHLPEAMRPTVLGLRGIGGSLAPAPPGPRWLCYGDSIVEGWKASAPAWAWPAQLARRLGLDLVNLGYAGAARGEIASAEQIAALPAHVITIAYGTNCWTRTPHSAALLAEGLRAFLAVLRESHPTTPITALSPILRLDAENTPNRLGATLADLRRAFETTVRQRIAAGDGRLALVSGASLVQAAELPDGIHPADAGHARIASAVGAVIEAQLRSAAR